MGDDALEADYVVIGAGACAMAFADVILTNSDRTLVMVDEHGQPGGHWNDVYPFVRLHQPSPYYGVPSRQLGGRTRDMSGLNEGLNEQATGLEVLSYFDAVMREQFLPTGRVTYLPMSTYGADGVAVSAITGRATPTRARRAVVDASYLGSEVPSTHTPKFAVDDDVTLIPINDLVGLRSSPAGFVILGAGKTSIDACLWLLERGVEPEKIVWVRPQDLWLLNRAKVQPDASQLTSFADMVEASAAAASVADLIQRFEAAELLLRIDTDYWPTTFRGATASTREIEELRRIDQVVRRGHVTHLESRTIHLERGDVPCGEGWAFVDCTAEGIRRRPLIPMFQPGRITLQNVQLFAQPTYSAATTARIELASEDDDVKNEACPSLPSPNELETIVPYLYARLHLPGVWGKLKGVRQWNDAVRLNSGSWALADVDPDDAAAQQAIMRIFEFSEPALENLRRLNPF